LPLGATYSHFIVHKINYTKIIAKRMYIKHLTAGGGRGGSQAVSCSASDNLLGQPASGQGVQIQSALMQRNLLSSK
jgi:hypothetical protein